MNSDKTSQESSASLWTRVTASRPCPVCSRVKGCSVAIDGAVICLRIASDHALITGLGGWLHRSDSERPEPNFAIPLVASARRAEPAALHAVYSTLLAQHPLLERHRLHLRQHRRLSADAIARRGYKSWGADGKVRSQSAKIAHERHGVDAIDTPGVILRNQGSGDYLTLAGHSGLAIPICNADRYIIGMQLKPDDPTVSKYTWLSSGSRGGAGCGTPVHVSHPEELRGPSGRVWLTEGPLKADIASDLLGQIVVAVPGAPALKQLWPTLERLVERGELKELVVAFDSDWHTNESVATQRKKAAEGAARLGIPVLLADWDTHLKGLDDLLQAGRRARLEPYQVHGAGVRPLQISPDPAALPDPSEPVYTLEQARELQDELIWEALSSAGKEKEDVGYLLRTLPGSGKSHALTRAANRHAKKKKAPKIAVFVPRHDLADEPGREEWRRVRGRTHLSDPLSEESSPCVFPTKQNRLIALRVTGQSGCERCPQKEVCRTNKTPGNGQPFYLNQFENRPPVTIYPAQHLLTPTLWANAGIVALDDCDLLSLCLEDVHLCRADLEKALSWANQHSEHAYAQAQPLLQLLFNLTQSVPAEHFEWSGEDLCERLDRLAAAHGIKLEDALRQALLSSEPDPFDAKDLNEAALDVPRRFVLDLARVLRFELKQHRSRGERELRGWNRRVRLERADETDDDVRLELKLRRDLPLAHLQGKTLLVLDASMSLEEARLLFPERRWKELDLKVAMPQTVAIHQKPDQNYGITRLRQKEVRKKALTQIREILESHPDEKIAVLSHKAFARTIKRELGPFHQRLEIGHYYGQRGSNRFADCTAQICFGTPFPNMEQVLRQAEALFWDGPTLNAGSVLQSQPHLNRKAGAPTYLSSVRAYTDPRLQRLFRSKSTDELIQAVYRLRPLSVDAAWLERNVQLDLFDQPAKPESDVRTRASVYIFSGLALPGLEVELHPPARQAPVVLELAAQIRRIRAAGQRLTLARLAKQVDAPPRAQIQRWIGTLRPLRGRLGGLSPPSHGPPVSELALCS